MEIVAWAIIIATVTLVSWTTGSVRARNQTRAIKAERLALEHKKAMEPRCLCNDWFNEHETGGGACRALAQDIRRKDLSYGADLSRYRCPCTGYMGPDPALSGLWQAKSD